MNKKSMEEFVKENGIYDEKEDSYSFSCSQAGVMKENVDLSHETFWMKIIITKNSLGINAYFVEDELARADESLKISVKDIMEFGDSAVQLVQEELKKLRRKAEFVSSVGLATKASDMYSRGCSMEEIHDFIIENMPGELPKEAHEELKSILSQFF